MNYKLFAARAFLLFIALYSSVAAYPSHRDFVRLIGGVLLVYVIAWLGSEIERIKNEKS